MSLLGRSDAARYRSAADAYQAIQDRYNAALQGPSDFEAIRDDVWDLQKRLFLDLAKHQPSAAVAGPLFSAARLSFQIESSTGLDWVRATTAALSFSSACSSMETFLFQRDEPMPEELLREMSGIPMFAAYGAHRSGVPLAGVMMAEAITSVALGDRMVARQTSAFLQNGTGTAEVEALLGQLQDRLPSARELRRGSRRGQRTALDLAVVMHQHFERDLRQAQASSDRQWLGNSPNAVAAVVAGAASGRQLVYVAPALAGGAALRINPWATGTDMCTSVELPGLDIESVRAVTARVHNAYAAAQRGQIGVKTLAGVLRAALDEVATAFWDPLLTCWPELRDTKVALVPIGEAAGLPLYTAPVGGMPACAALDLTLAPSARALMLAAHWPQPESNVLVAADPWFGADEIPRTVDEARQVAAVHGVAPHLFREPGTRRPQPADRSVASAAYRLRVSPERPADPVTASESAAPADIAERITAASLIHLTCHGRLQPREPLGSALLLGTEHALGDLLRNDLCPGATVVMSACQLGSIGDVLPDEQLGFPAALLAMGARSVIGALWPVPDAEATVTLMTDLHRGLTQSPATIAMGQAIGRADAAGVDPSVWSAFAHFGA